MVRKTALFFTALGFLLMSCTVGIVQEAEMTRLLGSPTPEPAIQATLSALQTQNAVLTTRMASLEQTQILTPTSTPTSAPPVVRIVVTATPTPPQTPTPTPTLTSTPCSIAVGTDFQPQFDQQGLVDIVGCPVAGPERVWSAEQTFEGGCMFWREGRDDAFVLFEAGARLLVTSDVYNEGEPDDACPELGSAPEGYFKPLRGFNRQWCKNAEVREQLGWAVENEVGYETTWQSFDRAVIVKNRAGHLFIFYNNGSWSYVD
ncbi:MAG: hypothetical protein JXA21_29680 [Anaerolineae bacterium]|nr:hypothetical protein [Anaerolineae bacterium]